MGRGLSDLQKDILKLAYSKYEDNAILSDSRILCDLFGFSEYIKWQHVDKGHERIIFDYTAIGEKKYNTAWASLSRSLKRLEQKKLIIRETWRLQGLVPGLTQKLIDSIMSKKEPLTDKEKEILNGALDRLGTREKLFHTVTLTDLGIETTKRITVKTNEQ